MVHALSVRMDALIVQHLIPREYQNSVSNAHRDILLKIINATPLNSMLHPYARGHPTIILSWRFVPSVVLRIVGSAEVPTCVLNA